MKATCLSHTYNLLNWNLNNWYHMYWGYVGGGWGMGNIWGNIFVVFMELITRGEFWRFDGQEGATKTEQVRRKEEFWSFCDNIIMNAHPHCPHEKVFTIGKRKHQRIDRMFQYLFKANLIILTNTSTTGQYTNSSPYTVSLRVITHSSVASMQ